MDDKQTSSQQRANQGHYALMVVLLLLMGVFIFSILMENPVGYTHCVFVVKLCIWQQKK